MTTLRMWSRAALVASLLVAAPVVGAWAQEPEAGGQGADITTLKLSTKLRVLDVTVVDKKGNPVTTGLKKEDFTIVDDRSKKDIVSFDVVNGTEGTVSVPTRTVFVIDHLNTTFEDQYWQINQLDKWLKDQGAVLNQETELLLLGTTGLQVVEGFTRDRQEMLEALHSIHSVNSGSLGPGGGNRTVASWDVENFSATLSALDEIALQMKSKTGRKNVIWIGTGGAGIGTEGLYHEEFLQRFVRRTANLVVDARVTVFLIEPSLRVSGKIQAPGGSDPVDTSVDPTSQNGQEAAPTATDPFRGAMNLGLFSRLTGGKIFLNSNDLVTEVHDSVALGTKYYTLSYKPETNGTDGSFKRIQVKVNNPNLRVLTKGGYYAAGKEDNLPVSAENDARFEVRKAAVSAVSFADVVLGVKGVTRYAPEQTETFEVDLRPGDLKLEQGADGVWKGQIVLAAVSTNGSHDILASASKALAVSASTPSMAHAKVPVLKLSIDLRVPRRTQNLRFVVRDMSSGKMGTFDMPRKVADATPVATTPMPQGAPKPASPGPSGGSNKPGF